MGVFVFLPLVLPLTAWPIAHLAERRLHPRVATLMLAATAGVLAVCSSLCLGLLVVVGTAQLPGNPLPDGWSDPEVREALPYDEVAGTASIPALAAVLVAVGRTLWRHHRTRRRAGRALDGLSGAASVAVLPDPAPYAYALPGRWGRGGRVVVSTALLSGLDGPERRALFAHERAHLAARHHRYLLAVHLAARANPFLRPLRTAVVYTVERWADEAAARAVGSRRTVARAIGKAALVSRGAPTSTLAGFAEPGPVPRRVAALLGPAPAVRAWPPVFTAAGLAVWTAVAGAAVSALSSANSAVTLFLVLRATTPL
ncbi:M48 family metalloprotease [Streptomyces sp. TRM43335]|uniref:M48 family metalloprotease n=1 Tax=Streptomyces taklimakanensis TaxID=2569853 RepID=A0A6G2BGN8_9ACTN|nr:M56 family metallopeptidase [Streptomyces taklimakanensis]MTE21428.1 M48 family metalloprotease [Streptomyces taklimakanensis]